MTSCSICFNNIINHTLNELINCDEFLTKRLIKHYNIYGEIYCMEIKNKENLQPITVNNNNNLQLITKKALYKCDKCGKEIINKQNYDLHIKNKVCQKIPVEFKCDKCNKIFREKRSLIYHNEHNVCVDKIEIENQTSNTSNTNQATNQATNNNTTNNNTTNNNTNNSTNIQTQNNQNQNIQTQNNQNIININFESTKNAEKIIEMIPFRTCGYKITPKKYLEYAKYPERAIKSFIKDEHFNPDKPERMNVLNTNYKSTKVSVLDYDEYDEMRWMLKSKNDINGLLCDRVINHLFMAKIMLQNAGIKLDAETEKKLNEQINEYENNDKVKKKYLDMISELSYNYRDMVEENKKKCSKLQLKN
jgi:predicted RNA-binding Zn-ribbon protein involved in translation (DUF1610 family)